MTTKKYTKEQIVRLKQAVEQAAGCKMSTPVDFDNLSSTIFEATHSYVSPTTLKRAWGYMRDRGSGYMPARFTLVTLSAYLGFKDFDEFIGYPQAEVQSKLCFGETIESAKLTEGALLDLWWSPNRSCRLCHQEGARFVVVSVMNCKLRAGDIVECTSFTQNAPFYFNRVFRRGCQPMSYVAGSRSGAHYKLVSKPN